MSVIVDTGVCYAQHDEDAPRHDTARAAMRRVLAGEYGQPLVSEYVFDETVTLTRARTGRYEDARRVAEHLDGPSSPFELLVVDEQVFERARAVFDRYDDHDLSFTDATTIALVEGRDIDHVLAFDDDFEGIVDRLDPDRLG